MRLEITIDILGWLGAFALLLAYAGVSTGRIQARTRFYQILNLLGSAFLVINSAWYRAFPSAFVNVVWISVAIYFLVSLSRTGMSENPNPEIPVNHDE